jgi:hypothetical protein
MIIVKAILLIDIITVVVVVVVSFAMPIAHISIYISSTMMHHRHSIHFHSVIVGFVIL